MNEFVKVALPASIALLGTLAGVAFAYRQSRRKVRDDVGAAFAAERRAAYKGLWERLEEVHAYARSLSVEPSAFDEQLRAVNVQLLKSEVYLRPNERALVNEYLTDLVALGTAAAAAASSPSAEREIYTTAPRLSDDTATAFAQLRTAFERVDADRGRLLPLFRAAMSGGTA